MANRRSRDTANLKEDWKHLVSVGGLLGAVLGTLILGAALQTDSTRPAPERAASPPSAAGALPDPAAMAGLIDLDDLAAADARRLASSREEWTLQFMLACDPDNIRPKVEALRDDPELFLLTKLHDGRRCFRICWGRFASREEALAARRFPAALGEITSQPRPLSIAEGLQ